MLNKRDAWKGEKEKPKSGEQNAREDGGRGRWSPPLKDGSDQEEEGEV